MYDIMKFYNKLELELEEGAKECPQYYSITSYSFPEESAKSVQYIEYMYMKI